MISKMETHLAVPDLSEIERRVLQVVARECEKYSGSLSLNMRLVEDLGIDSLEIVEVVMGLEDEFDIDIPDEAAKEFFTKASTLHTLVALTLRCWDSTKPWRNEWLDAHTTLQNGEEVPSTQLGPEAAIYREEQLYLPLGPNREGYAECLRRTDGMRCILIPSGLARLGVDLPDAHSDQTPSHTVKMSAYLIDAEPVSNAAFARFLNSIGDVSPEVVAEWCGVDEGDKRQAHLSLVREQGMWKPFDRAHRQPMILVSWFGANAYSLWAHLCDWSRYREDQSSHLPSEAQWEYAASGGIQVQSNLAVGSDARVAQHTVAPNIEPTHCRRRTISERLGMSSFGLHHMAGNVWQWCRDWYSPDFYRQPEATEPNPQNKVDTGIRSERGGSWVGPAALSVPWYRRGRPPAARGRCLGFRCATRGIPI